MESEKTPSRPRSVSTDASRRFGTTNAGHQYRVRKGTDSALTYKLLSPLKIIIISWLIPFAIFIYINNTRGMHLYFEDIVDKEGLVDQSNMLSYVVIGVNFALFALGVLLANSHLANNQSPMSRGVNRRINLNPLIFLTTMTAVIALLWLGGAAASVGGVGALAQLAASDNAAAREALRSASFPGGRLVSYGFIGISAISSAFIVQVESKRQRRILALLIGVSLVYLATMPMLVSGRITFFVATISSYVSATLSARRYPSLKLLVIGVALLAVVWTAKQYFTLGHIQSAQSETIGSQAVEGFLFYIYNDVINALNAPNMLGDARTWGWYSIRFVYFMTFTDRLIQHLAWESFASVNRWLVAGEIPLLMAPFVDFGYFGSILLAVMGYICQKFYRTSLGNARSAAVYGLLFAGLTMSSHSAFITSQEVVYSILLAGFVSRLCEKSPKRHIVQSRRTRMVGLEPEGDTIAGLRISERSTE